MAVFAYTAKTADGKKVESVIRAADKGAAQAELKKKNLTIATLVEQKGAKKSSIFGPPRPHVKTKDIAVLTRQLSTMISAGIPLLESLEILHEQASDPGFKLALDKIIERVRSGSDFSTALSEHPKLFSKIYVNMIKAGEASGQLDVILQRLADYMEAAEELKREIKAAMTYPVISLVLILSITIGLVVGIVPKFKTIFDQLGMNDLPAPTQLLLTMSDQLRNNYVMVMAVTIAVIVAFLMYIKTKPGMRQWHWFLLHAPVFGPLFRKVAISRFSRTFATLIQSGVPMLGALDIVAATAGNILVEEAVLKAKDAVTKGETLGEPLTATRVFPPMVTRMISIGEKTGALEKLLMKIAEFYDQEVRATVKALTSLIEPLLIATMGLIVGFIVLSIFLPIIKIQETLSNK
ncbi:MAG TPA: type II secretion system F family protein [Planctomycetota bacterium]|jgi:type IV pilus assembly protein PilC|nr:type II secretion system F family protein [Planctomycetota bacterium]